MMLNQRLMAAQKIARALRPAEADIDTAIDSITKLVSAIIEGRRESGVHFSMCQESLASLSAALSGLTGARMNIVNAHAALAEDRVKAGLRAVGVGDYGDCPPTGALKIVSDDIQAAA